MKKMTLLEYQKFLSGELYDAYLYFGAHLVQDEKELIKTVFTVYAPRAQTVSVVGEFNDYNLETHLMVNKEFKGIFTLTIPQNLQGLPYKYAIKTLDKTIYKSDPFAFYSAYRPDTVSIVYPLLNYPWSDETYMKESKSTPPYHKAMIHYEMHLGSWRRHGDGTHYRYQDFIDTLIPYLLEQGYTHVEIMPLSEHPLDGSWGYQSTGYYSATSRYGTPRDLMALIDACHKNNIGVIIDWVVSHICKDEHGLYFFDGSPLYEHNDHILRENIEWGTANLDLSKGITKSFLISNAYFWMRYFHVDGFRIDAVANIIFALGDENRGVDQDAITFLKQLSTAIFSEHPHALLIAEDSTSFPKVTAPIEEGGLGFNYKWNMGWMNDTLKYFMRSYEERRTHGNELTFSMLYAYSENYILPFSHDEVVHGKQSLIEKMPGDYWQKFANYRLLIGYMQTHPGKKLLFMGQEFAHFKEWNYEEELDWVLLKYPMHQGAKLYTRDFNRLVKKESALHSLDHHPNGFKWIDHNVNKHGVISFVRYASNQKDHVVVLLNFTPETHLRYSIGVPYEGTYTEIINSDLALYGGSNLSNTRQITTSKTPCNGYNQSIEVLVAALAIIVLKWSD